MKAPLQLLLVLLLTVSLTTCAKDRPLKQPKPRRHLKQLKRQQQQQQHENNLQNPFNNRPPSSTSSPLSDKNSKKLSPEEFVTNLLKDSGNFAKVFQLERKPSSKKSNSKDIGKPSIGKNQFSRSGKNKRVGSYPNSGKPRKNRPDYEPDQKSQNQHLPSFGGDHEHQKLTPDQLAQHFLKNDQYAQLLNFAPDLTTQQSDIFGEGVVRNDKNNNDKSDVRAGVDSGYYDTGHYDDNDVDGGDDNDDDDDDDDDGGWGNVGQSPINNSFETLLGKHFSSFDNTQWYPDSAGTGTIPDGGARGMGDGDGDISTSGYISFMDLGNHVQVTDCPQSCLCKNTVVDCSAQNFTSVPKGIKPITTVLDLSMNNLQKLPEDSFAHLPRLEELRIVGNNLTRLPKKLFKHNTVLRLLNFQGNQFVKVPPRAFQNLNYLLELHLDANAITTIPKKAFKGLFRLQQLRLDANHLDHIPTEAMRELTGLQAVAFAMNQIQRIPALAFQNNTKLIHLLLSDNHIEEIEDDAFIGLTRLKYLQLERNRIPQMPTAFSHLINLEELNLERNSLSFLPDMCFQFKDKLSVLGLRNNPIKSIGDRVFSHLPSLTELVLSEVHDLTRFPDLTGTTSLTRLQLDRASIKSLPKELCRHLPNITSFDIHSNKIGTIPNMSLCVHLSNLNMANNELTSLDGQLFKGLTNLHDLTLSNNFIHTIPEDAFIGLSSLEYLNMAENQISSIHPDAFVPLKSLTDLNLGENHISNLPTAGLSKLQKLKVFHNKELREFPPKEAFPHINHFVLAYAYHCCDFINSRQEHSTQVMLRENIIWMGGFRVPGTGHHNGTYAWPLFPNKDRKNKNMTIDKNHDVIMKILNGEEDFSFSGDGNEGTLYPDGYNYEMFHMLHENSSEFGGDGSSYEDGAYDHEVLLPQASISCRPKPGPFMPCDDLFGWWSLRCGVWIVFLLALLGNFVVFFVSVTSRSKMDVPRFLICNLALADFFMGIYLGILAIVDASTLGQFKKYAIQWQMSPGCLVAGFLGVFSSELSVFTLTVITLERFYAITHAMQLNKRLSLKHSSVIMLAGWIFCFGMATMPLFGISDYRKFAICLPFEIEDLFSKGFVCFIMTFNGIAFFIILSCYLIMYISIRDSQAWNSNETRVAKRMALLVFTDFMCWAPIAFLSLAAAFGKHLIHLNEAKVLTIFILPLNSCANPFLYAFFTKQFKKDCVLFCRRLEDSSIARHFSQVSQRHVSVSWKCQRRQSGLNSLMGDGKSQNSQNNSQGSNSYGLVNNYNSEVSSGTNKEANVKDTWAKDMKSNFRTPPKANGKFNGKPVGGDWNSDYKYCPCPNDNIDDVEGQVDAHPTSLENVQGARHADPYSQQVSITDSKMILCQSNTSGDNNNNNNNQRKDTKHHRHHPNTNSLKINTSFNSKHNNAAYKQAWSADEELGIISDEESSVWKKMVTEVDDIVNDTLNNVGNTVNKIPAASPVGVTKLGSVDSYYSVEQPIRSPQHNTNQDQIPDSYLENNFLRGINNEINSCGKPGDLRKNMQKQNHVRSSTASVSAKHKRRKNIQCCSANSSPIDHSGYEFVSEQKRKRGYKKGSHQIEKTPNVQYVMTMPEDLEISHKIGVENQKIENVLKCCTAPDLIPNVEKIPVQMCSHDLGVNAIDRRSYSNKDSNDHLVREKSHSHCAEGKDNRKLTIHNSEKHRHNDSSFISNKKQEMLITTEHLVHKPLTSSRTLPNTTGFPVLTREFLHHHTAVDKSVHLRYFQQSIAGHDFVCKSNSLVELSQSQLEDARVQPMSVTNKRGSLSPRKNDYENMIMNDDASDGFVDAYRHQHQQQSHYCHFRQCSTGEVSDDCSCCFSPDPYTTEQTSDSLEDDYSHSHITTELAEGLNFRHMPSDRKRAKQEEVGGLLVDSDTDDFEGKQDSISSAKNSADKESGFHSQN